MVLIVSILAAQKLVREYVAFLRFRALSLGLWAEAQACYQETRSTLDNNDPPPPSATCFAILVYKGAVSQQRMLSAGPAVILVASESNAKTIP